MDRKEMPTPYEGKENYIFVSYSHQDMDRVLPIIQKWMSDGFRVWYDDGISPGTEWPEVIARHLNDCALFVAFMSNSYMDSFNCKREIDFAVRKRKTFMTVFLEETELSLGVEMQISTVQSIEYYKTTQEAFLERFYDLAVVKESGCRVEAAPTAPVATTQEVVQAAAAVAPAAVPATQPGPKKKKIFIPILLGVLVLLGIAGAAIGIGIANSNTKNTSGTNARVLELADVTVTDKVLRKAVRGKDIREIKIKNCEISVRNKAIWSEVLNEKASQITITGCALKDDDAKEILANAPALKTLVLKDNELKEVSFEKNPNLQSADLSGNQITHIEKTNLENLTVLRVDDNRLTDLGFLETAVHLHTLSAERNNIESIDVLKNCAILAKVSLAENQITDVSALGNAKDRIEELNLSDNQISDLDCIWPLTALRRLSVDNNRLTTIYLTESKKLSYLSARNNKIDSLSGDFEALAYLDVADNNLSGEYYFTDCPKLKTGFFENNQISAIRLDGGKYADGKFVLYNNPLVKLDIGDERTSYELYVSYKEELKSVLENKCGRHLYLLDCPNDLRVSFEKAWGQYTVDFPEKNEAVEAVEKLRKSF